MPELTSHNPLITILALVTAGGIAGAAYLVYVARGNDTPDVRKEFGAIFFVIGLFSLGGFVQLIWSDWAGFPANHYSELYGTTTGLYAFMLIVAGFFLYQNMNLRAVAWPAALFSLYILQGARAVLVFELTKSPPVTFVLWLAAGLAALGILPFTYSEGSTRKKLAYAGAAVLIVMSLAALSTGVGGFFSHIASAVQG